MDLGSVEREADSFFSKWIEAWPSLKVARLFASDGEWPVLRAKVGVLLEVGECCWILRDATVSAHKLAWWREEIDLHRRGQARHPLLRAAPTLRLTAHAPLAAIAALDEPAPATADEALARIVRLVDPEQDVNSASAMQAFLVALFLLALREAKPGAFAQAPLNLRARHGVAKAEIGGALDALVGSLAEQWREGLRAQYQTLVRRDYHGRRGLRVVHRTALALIDRLATGQGALTFRWHDALSAWWSVAGLH